jgi:hypothetical protein
MDGLRKVNEAADAGFAMYSRESRCWHTGVPVYLNNPAQPTFFLQTPKQVTMIWMDSRCATSISMCRIGESETVLVRRIGKALRRRMAGGRHDRPRCRHLHRQFSYAAQRQAEPIQVTTHKCDAQSGVNHCRVIENCVIPIRCGARGSGIRLL